jgi:hypothetical protein
MAAVNLLMADCAVLKPRGSQIVESRRHYSGGCLADDCGRQIGMTFETHLLHHGSRQHARIRRSMRLMACGAIFEPDRRMFKREWTALVAMTLETAGFIGAEVPGHRATCAAVRVVAIDAGHGAFRHSMVKRLLKLSHRIDVACGALLVDGRGLARHQSQRTVGVDLVARGAGHLIFCVTALQAAGLCRLA